MEEIFDGVDTYYKAITIKSISECLSESDNAGYLYAFLFHAFLRRYIINRVQFDGGCIEELSNQLECKAQINIHCKLSPSVCSIAIDNDFDVSDTQWTLSVPLYEADELDKTGKNGLDVLAESTVEVNPYHAWSPSVMKNYIGY